ncbi:MAG: multidrug transporter AcrB [Acidobacteria bacterium RIFCSPLOWO2_02_FULL_61_28]|nr:MAG: multidrug transporter AcrB [Acidobacteria bacterium RIFCSPLOWO2_02_FULL_61_28]
MIDGLIRWSLKHRLLVLTLAAAFLAWGGYLASTMPVDVLPDLTAPTVTILAEAPGMAPTEMESLVTFPIETSLNGASGVRRVRSATAVGVAIIWVEFDWGEDIYRARQNVSEKLNLARNSLPPEVEVVLAPISSIMGEILFLSLESDRHSPLELRTVADTILRRRLLSVPGVSQVISTGGGQKQYQVLISSAKLKAYDLSLDNVVEALRSANQNTSAGFRVAGGQEYLIQAIGRVSNLDDIAQTVVVSRDSRPILLRDLGEVRIGQALKRGEGSHNGKLAVILGIQKQPGANTLDLTRTLDQALNEIEPTLPQGMKIDRDAFRQADFIRAALGNLLAALRDGGFLVVLVVVLFLASTSASVITLLAIPLSLVAAIGGLKIAGLTINAMTLGGLAIAIGELVDDAIIDVENVFRRLRENKQKPEAERLPALEIVYSASSEIRGSIVYATLIVILVFVPLFLLESVEGRLLKPLGYAYVVALTASLVVALTVTPALCSLLLPRAKKVLQGAEPTLVRWLKRGYQPILRWSLNHTIIILVGAVTLFAAALGSFHWVGRAFLPEFNEGALTISAVTLPGTSLAESDKLGQTLERILLGVPEVVSTARRTGREELDEHVQGVESAEIDVRLVMRQRPKDEVLNEIREKVTLLPGMNVTVGQPISHRIDHMLSGTRANVAVKIFGEDLFALRAIAKQVESVMREVDGVVDLSTEQQTDIPTVRVRLNREALARYGLGAGAAAETLQTAFSGRPVGQVLEGQFAFPLVVRYQNQNTADIESIQQTQIDTPGGLRIPLAAVADIREDRGPNFINRENVQRKIVVQCNVAGRDLRSVVNDIERRVQSSVQLPRGYRIEYGGQFESEARASQRLLWLGVLVVIGILVILFTAFDSLRDALIIMANLPLALIGGAAGVFVAGGVLSVASIIGFITLFGIATRNGIMLISHVRHLMTAEGVQDLRQAVITGASERLAPILMTALTAGLALIPVALGMGKPGSELQAPMAIVILFGLLSSTALNMIVVPSIYARFGKRSAS